MNEPTVTSSNRSNQQPLTIHDEFAAVSDMFGSNVVEDPHQLYKKFRQSEPVMEGDILARFGVPSQADYSNLGRRVFTLFKYEDVTAVLRDAETYTSGLLNEGIGQFFGGFLMTGMEPERHKLVRSLLAPAFSPSAIAKWKNLIKSATQDVVTSLNQRNDAELVNDMLLPLPVRIIYGIMGYPQDEALIQEYASRALRILVGPQRDPEKMRLSMEAALQATRDLYDDTITIVRRRRAEGSTGDDLIGYLLRAQYDGKTLDDASITELMRQFLPAAAETTTRSFGSMLVALFQQPALLEQVRVDRSLVPKVINEGMRWETATQFLARQCARDVEIRGIKIPAGSALSLALGSANRDEDIFERPDEFDIYRPMKTAVGFGFGAHMCLGMQIAKLEMESMMNALFDCLPNLRLDPTVPEPKILGAQLRGPRAIHVIWD